MTEREYLLKQAETCLRLAASTTDEAVARKLREMAAEYQVKAQEADPPKEN